MHDLPAIRYQLSRALAYLAALPYSPQEVERWQVLHFPGCAAFRGACCDCRSGKR